MKKQNGVEAILKKLPGLKKAWKKVGLSLEQEKWDLLVKNLGSLLRKAGSVSKLSEPIVSELIKKSFLVVKSYVKQFSVLLETLKERKARLYSQERKALIKQGFTRKEAIEIICTEIKKGETKLSILDEKTSVKVLAELKKLALRLKVRQGL